MISGTGKRTIKPLILALAILSGSSHASFKHFEADMSDSLWKFQGNPLSCKLEHPIPFYGTADFSKTAGKNEKLGFNLSYSRHQLKEGTKAKVRALAPAWQPQLSSRELGDLVVSKGNNVLSSKEIASWKLLNELEVGRLPTFYYQDFNDIEDQVAVSLSTVGFRSEYGKFLNCLTSLVPYKLHELSKMTLYFDFDQSKVKPNYKSKLVALAQYIKHDPSVEIVIINGFTDSKGPRYYNEKLSQRRAESVKNLLQLPGVSDERFKVSAFGEKRPKASNRTQKGRALNRRVFIRLAQQ